MSILPFPRNVVLGVPFEKLSMEIWGQATELLVDAIPETESLSDIYRWLEDGDAQLWVVFDRGKMVAALITQIIRHSQKTICLFRHFGGKVTLGRLLAIRRLVYAWAKAHHCNGWEIVAQANWEKVIRKLESNVRATVLLRGDW
jgi:hypothetical protein